MCGGEAYTCHSTNEEIRRQLSGISSFLPPWVPGHQTHMASALTTEPSRWPNLYKIYFQIISLNICLKQIVFLTTSYQFPQFSICQRKVFISLFLKNNSGICRIVV